MTIEQDIQRISGRIELMSNHYFETREMLLADGELDSADLAILDELADRLTAAQTRVSALMAQQTGEAIPGSEDERIETGTVSGSQTAVPFSNSDFKTALNGSIRDWAGEAATALGPVVDTILSRDSEATAIFGASDALAILGLVFPTSAIIPAVSVCVPILNNCVSSVFSGGGNSELAISRIEDQWTTALRNFGQSDFSDTYQSYVEHWKRENQVSGDELPPERVNEFSTACRNFGKERSNGGQMPNCLAIKRAFLAKLIELTEDSHDLDDQSGDAEINMSRQSTPRGYAWEVGGGQIDDMSAGLLDAINTLYSASTRIIDLPVVINITISFDAGMRSAEIRRSSTTPGNTDFRLVGGGEHEQALFGSFVSDFAFERPRVSHLRVDS